MLFYNDSRKIFEIVNMLIYAKGFEFLNNFKVIGEKQLMQNSILLLDCRNGHKFEYVVVNYWNVKLHLTSFAMFQERSMSGVCLSTKTIPLTDQLCGIPKSDESLEENSKRYKHYYHLWQNHVVRLILNLQGRQCSIRRLAYHDLPLSNYPYWMKSRNCQFSGFNLKGVILEHDIWTGITSEPLIYTIIFTAWLPLILDFKWVQSTTEQHFSPFLNTSKQLTGIEWR